MKRTDLSHFSHVLAGVQRTGSLPGGSIRGLPNGVVIDGLQGFHSFALEIAEAQRDLKLGRVRSALERIKQLEIQFNGIANQWDSSISALIADVRQGKQLKNLEKLKELKAARLRMQQLVSPARKAFQDLVTVLNNDAIAMSRQSPDVSLETPRREHATKSDALQDPKVTLAEARPNKISGDETPDADALGSFASNYRCGPKLRLARDANEKLDVASELERGKFYYLAGLEPPRVVRIRELQPKVILVFDTLRLHEATLTTNEFADLIPKGVWVLVSDN